MHILYLTQFLPLPLDHGGVIKTYSTLKTLKKLGHEIYIFSFVTYKEQFRHQAKLLSEGFHIGNTILYEDLNKEMPYKKLILFIKSFFTHKPFSVLKFFDKNMQISINNFSLKENIDCIWVDNFTMAQYLPKEFSGLKVLDTHNVESLFFKEMFLTDSFILWKIFALYEWIKYRLYEKNIYNKFDKIFAINQDDKESLIKITRRPDIAILSPIVQTPKLKKLSPTPNTLLFVGSLCWYPNKDGIYWFLKNVYPKLLEKIPYIQFWVVGKLPRRGIFPKPQGVKFYGYQKLLSKYYRKAKIFVCPIRYGSGIRIKLLEAIQWNIPIISTSVGARGIDFKNNSKMIISNEINDMTSKICLLLSDKNVSI